MGSLITHYWRGFLARLPLPMLALAAAYGVYEYASMFVPQWVAIIQASAFELTYIGLAVQSALRHDLRRRATAISVGAVIVSILYNTLSGLFHRMPGLLASMPFWGEWVLAGLHGAPLAWVAYLVSDLLLHQETAPAERIQRVETRQTPNFHENHEDSAQLNIADDPQPAREPSRTYTCKYCNETELTASENMMHGRRHSKYGTCHPQAAVTPAAD